ncbi:MAG: CpaE family protein [Alphaproteobacteria bacterium]
MALAAADPDTGATHVLAAFAADAAMEAVLAEAAATRFPGATIASGGAAAAARWLARGRAMPAVLVVDLGDSATPYDDLMALADLCAPATRVVALGAVNDLALYRRFLAAGVADYLVRPVAAPDLAAALAKAVETGSGGSPTTAARPAGGRLVAVVGVRGGVGASTLALNAAALSAGKRGQRTALVDLDLAFGTLALGLDLEPSGGVAEALARPERIDALFLASAGIRRGERLLVFAAEDDLARPGRVGAEAATRLLDEVREASERVWIDLPRGEAIHASALLAAPDRVLLVADPSLAAARDAARLAALAAASGAASVALVLVDTGRRGALSTAEIERSAGLRVVARLPHDRHAAAAAAAGRPLVEAQPRGPYARALEGLLDKFDPAPRVRRGLRLIGGGRR